MDTGVNSRVLVSTIFSRRVLVADDGHRRVPFGGRTTAVLPVCRVSDGSPDGGRPDGGRWLAALGGWVLLVLLVVFIHSGCAGGGLDTPARRLPLAVPLGTAGLRGGALVLDWRGTLAGPVAPVLGSGGRQRHSRHT